MQHSTPADRALNANPDWQGAAQSLVNALSVLEHDDERLDFLEDLCEGMGPNLYPAFLHTLYNVEATATRRAQELVGKTLVGCLLSGRLPSGEASAWGANTVTASPESVDGGFSHQRRLGPIEYLCAWHLQSGALSGLNNPQFIEALSSLLRLIGTEKQAAELYQQHIEAQLSDPVAGAFNQLTRRSLQSLVDDWGKNLPEHTIAERCLQAYKPQASINQLVPR